MSSTDPPHKVYSIIMESSTYKEQLLKSRCRNQRILIVFLLGVTFSLICAVTYLSLKLHLGGAPQTGGKSETTLNVLGNETQFISGNNLEIEPLEEINSDRSDKSAKKDRNTPKNTNYRPRPASHQKLNITATRHMHNGSLVWQTHDFDGVTFIQGRMKVTDGGRMYALIPGVYEISVQVKFDSVINHMASEKYNVRLCIIKISEKIGTIKYDIAQKSFVTLYRGEYRVQSLRMNLRLRRNEGFFVVATRQFLYESSEEQTLDISLID